MDDRNQRVLPVDIEDEMRDSYISYAMSVIVGRALPDVKDGLKPVQRRILYAMKELGLEYNKPYKKSARIVGEVLGKFHPHGDMAVYDALVRMAQDFSLRYPLIDGQGNFGCFTKDTKVLLCDGRALSFKELIAEQKQGKRHWTFSFNSQAQKIEIAEIKTPRLTRRKEKIIEVLLDNGGKIKCTPEHPFMLRDGRYKKAKDLKQGDSLMPVYIKEYDGRENPDLKGYQIVYQPKQYGWEFVHHLADEWNLSSEIYRRSAGKIRHHLDFNTDNGVPKIENALNYFKDKESAQQYNHKVIKTKALQKQEDVYDLTVEPWHNFPLACGVFVHNSVDGDTAAAMRYTEVRLEEIAELLLEDIDKDTVDFMPNFDETLQEPTVLPARLPALLINGSSGIAVGMATNIPPHNLNEIIDGVLLVIDNPECTIEQLMRSVKGPDFPTGGLICGREGIKEAYSTGKGLLKVRARALIERQKSGKSSIVITEIPYQVNKTSLIESIAHLVQNKRIEGISDLRDESDREGMRIVVELKRDQNEQVVLNQLYKHTQMETTLGVTMLALVEGRPRILNLKQAISLYIEHRKQVIRRRTQFELNKAKARAHILEGLKTALGQLDKVIKSIRRSKTVQEAKEALIGEFSLTPQQAQAILEMQLQRLTHLERERIDEEYLELIKKIELYSSILSSERKVLEIIKEEAISLGKRFADPRRSEILEEITEFEMEDLVAKENMAITVTGAGYIKRLPVSTYRKQKRGGRGVTAMETKEEDFIEHLFIASTHDYILIFTDRGKVYWLKVYEIPQGGRTAKGKAIANLLNLSTGESISSLFPVREFKKDRFLIMSTKGGLIKKTSLGAFRNPRKGGIIAIGLQKGDELIETALTDGHGEILLATRAGKVIRFKETQVRDMGRAAKGVKGISLGKRDELIAMEVVRPETTVLTITQKGFGKRTDISKYRTQSRAGKGIINIKITKRNGEVASVKSVADSDEVMIITEGGMIVRCSAKDIRLSGRNAQGVRIIKLDEKDRVASVARIVPEED